ncbi:MAG TPA: hypothetical protein VIN09_10565 [Chloroflexota bacterium]
MRGIVKRVGVLGVGLALIALGDGAATSRAVPEILPVYEQGSAFKYTTEVHELTGAVRAYVTVAWDDPAAVERYREANASRIRTLIASGRGESVPVTVTFAEPVPPSEVERLAEDVGFTVAYYTLVGRSSDVDRWTRTVDAHFVPLSQVATSETIRNHRTGADHHVRFLGVMVLKGTVAATGDGLGRLAEDPRVYLADTTAVEVLDRLARDGRYAGKPVESVGLETPFWSFDW